MECFFVWFPSSHPLPVDRLMVDFVGDDVDSLHLVRLDITNRGLLQFRDIIHIFIKLWRLLHDIYILIREGDERSLFEWDSVSTLVEVQRPCLSYLFIEFGAFLLVERQIKFLLLLSKLFEVRLLALMLFLNISWLLTQQSHLTRNFRFLLSFWRTRTYLNYFYYRKVFLSLNLIFLTRRAHWYTTRLTWIWIIVMHINR